MKIPKAYIALITMGCPKNEVDSFDMRCALEDAGYAFVEQVEDAQIVLINTCAFLQEAVEENLDVILEIAQTDLVQSGKLALIVAGCLTSRYGDDLCKELPEVKAFVPCKRENEIVSVVDEVFDTCFEQQNGSLSCLKDSSKRMLPPVFEGPVSAYVKIADGCNRYCSFCVIPYIRGRFHSFAYEQIKKDVIIAQQNKAREIVLIAQDTGIWGTDFDQPSSLAWLVNELAHDFPQLWFRVLYLEPDGVTDDYLRAVASNSNVCSYFDIPMQHCNDVILKAMNRHGSTKEFLDLISHIRKMVDGAVIRTTLIAGFPGETDEQFNELVDFVEKAEFEYVGVFPYSQEEGTRAFDLPGQVDAKVKIERAQKIRDLADTLSTNKVASRIGNTCDVLVEGIEEDDQLFGRTQFQAPEIDGYTYVDSGNIGDIISVQLVDSLFYELEGEAQ